MDADRKMDNQKARLTQNTETAKDPCETKDVLDKQTWTDLEEVCLSLSITVHLKS